MSLIILQWHLLRISIEYFFIISSLFSFSIQYYYVCTKNNNIFILITFFPFSSLNFFSRKYKNISTASSRASIKTFLFIKGSGQFIFTIAFIYYYPLRKVIISEKLQKMKSQIRELEIFNTHILVTKEKKILMGTK